MHKPKLILGAPDALAAYICRQRLNADYIWASSLVLSALEGKRDDGIVDIASMRHSINALVKGGDKVVMDFDIAGRDLEEVERNLIMLNKSGVVGVSIEDEGYPKVNAMLDQARSLIQIDAMAAKLTMARRILGDDALIIGRTHSYIVGEPVAKIQDRITRYEKAGANAICIHYAGNDWDSFIQVYRKIIITGERVLILAKATTLPEALTDIEWDYLIWPNQIYRAMLKSIADITFSKTAPDATRWPQMVSPEDLFELVELINQHGPANID